MPEKSLSVNVILNLLLTEESCFAAFPDREISINELSLLTILDVIPFGIEVCNCFRMVSAAELEKLAPSKLKIEISL